MCGCVVFFVDSYAATSCFRMLLLAAHSACGSWSVEGEASALEPKGALLAKVRVRRRGGGHGVGGHFGQLATGSRGVASAPMAAAAVVAAAVSVGPFAGVSRVVDAATHRCVCVRDGTGRSSAVGRGCGGRGGRLVRAEGRGRRGRRGEGGRTFPRGVGGVGAGQGWGV